MDEYQKHFAEQKKPDAKKKKKEKKFCITPFMWRPRTAKTDL